MSVIKSAFPTGSTSSSVLGIKKWAPAEVRVGQPTDFYIEVSNLTNLKLNNVVVSEGLSNDEKANSGNFKLTSSSPEVSGDADTLIWNLGNLDPKESRTIKFTGVSSGVGPIPCCTEVTYDPTLCLKQNIVDPGLALAIQAPAEAILCDSIPLTFTVSNPGRGSARNVIITSLLPSGLKTLDGKNSVSYNANELPSGEKREFTVNVKAAQPGKYSSQGTATADSGLSTKAQPVSVLVRQPKLALNISGPSTIIIGRNVQYKIAVSNRGDAIAKGVVIESPLPSYMTFVSASDGGSASDGKVIWSVGSIPPNQSKNITVTLKSSKLGSATSSVVASGVCCNDASAVASTELKGVPAVLLEVIDVKDPISVGESTTYIINVTNQGSAKDTNIKITGFLEDNVMFVSASGATRGSLNGVKVEFIPLASLEVGQKASWIIEVKAVKPGDSRFKAIMTTDQLTRPVGESEATNVY